MLQHGRFIFAESIGSGGFVLLKASVGCSLSLSHIGARARGGTGPSTRDVVDDSYRLFFGKLVLGLDQELSDRAARPYASADAFGV